VTPGRASAFRRFRELILGVILGIMLALVATLLQTLQASAGPIVRDISGLLFFLIGLGFGLVLWLGSRRERELRRIYEAIANVTTGGVVVDNVDGQIVFANAKFAEMVGRSMSDVVGKKFTDVVAPESRALADGEYMRRRLGASSVYEIDLVRPDGGAITALVSGQSLMAGERYTGSASFFLDITQRKRAEREVTQAKELAEFFLDLITHDISNINQGIRGFAEIMRLAIEAPAERRKATVEKILGQVDRSNTLITNIKKISELRWAWADSPQTTLDVEEAIRQAIAMAMGSFPGRHVEIRFTNRAGAFTARGDYLATELFYNLIHNAIKYTTTKDVEVVVDVEKLPKGSALVTVSDSGPGIPDDAKELLFSRIAPSKRENQPSGYHSGVGLTLVRLISERFGWKVWAENRARGDYTQGTSFCIEIQPL